MLIRNSIQYGAAPVPPAYPASVVSKGLQAVWDLQSTAGRTQSYLKDLDIDGPPPGWYYDAPTSTLGAPASGSPVLSRYKLHGVVIYVDGNNDVAFEQCGFTGAPFASAERGRAIRINANGGLARVYLEDCTLTGEESNPIVEAMVGNHGRLYITRTRFENCARDFISSFSLDTPDLTPACELHMTDVYLKDFGQRGGDGTHYEPVHAHCGVHTQTRVFVDGRNGCDLAPAGSGVTAIGGYPQPRQGPMEWQYENCIAIGKEIAGAAAPQSAYNVYSNNSPNGNATGVLNNCVLSKGTGKHVEADGSTITGSGNVDFYNSAPITDGALTA